MYILAIETTGPIGSVALVDETGRMIASAAYYKYKAFGADDLTLDAYPALDM